MAEYYNEPEYKVTYVEVPVPQEVIRTVPRREVVEIEKRVPRKEYVHTEKIVEVPQIEYVIKEVEIPQIQEVVKHVPRKEFVDVPREVIKYVPKVEIEYVDNIVEVPGEIIEVPKAVNVENRIDVPVYHDRTLPMTVAQTIVPVFHDHGPKVLVPLSVMEPRMVPVDVYIPVPVEMPLYPAGTWTEHRLVNDVPDPHYDHLVKTANSHLEREHVLPLLKGDDVNRDFTPFLNVIAPIEPADRIPELSQSLFELPPVRGDPRPSRMQSGVSGLGSRLITQSNMDMRSTMVGRPNLDSRSNLLGRSNMAGGSNLGGGSNMVGGSQYNMGLLPSPTSGLGARMLTMSNMGTTTTPGSQRFLPVKQPVAQYTAMTTPGSQQVLPVKQSGAQYTAMVNAAANSTSRPVLHKDNQRPHTHRAKGGKPRESKSRRGKSEGKSRGPLTHSNDLGDLIPFFPPPAAITKRHGSNSTVAS
ncbi:MAG: uncharacterized protein KVP18_000057 [Porospora cf. gigantea A]|uniref:uncharacterized protein n=1 Tax=Porospora cf. gigantea A TaxID=2853593 RepID=UPI00355A4220|nr:MAG: hypothetical protein KVP18_000057 [Porospora cf. gigantea A]